MAKPALGRGLGALLGGSPAAAASSSTNQPAALPADTSIADARDRVQRVPLARIRPCSLQPRKDFSADALRELADSIKEQGIVQPLIVRERGGGFELIAGERRWRAAQMSGLTEAPIVVREADDRTVLELALIENLQRENLNAIEEAQGYAQLTEQFQLTQEEVSAKVGKSRAVVANALRLLKLAPEIQAFVRTGRLSVGHAKVILGLAQAEEQKLAVERVLKHSLNVRQTEDLVANLQKRTITGLSAKPGAVSLPTDSHVAELERRLRERLGTKVNLRYRQGKGTVQIHFYNDVDLERVLEVIGVKLD